jgi:hypothetical protein
MNIAYTGTQQGMNEAQMLALRSLIPQGCKFRHGDCIGGDSQAHLLAIRADCEIYIHPCTVENKRAYNTGIGSRRPVVIYPARPPLLRNGDMVTVTEWLIATPFQDQEVLRSGTWSTIRYAMKHRQTFDGAYRITQIKRDGTLCEL